MFLLVGLKLIFSIAAFAGRNDSRLNLAYCDVW